MLRLLGQSEYGLYNLVASVVAYLSLLNFGFGGAYMRYFSKYKAEGNRVKIAKLNGMFLIIFALISVIAFTVGMVLVQYTDGILGTELTVGELKKAKILMSLMVINIALSFPNIVFNSHITANEKFVFQKLLQLIQSVVNPFVILPVLIMGYGSVGMVVATTLLNITIEIINIVFCRKRLGMKFIFRDLDFNVVKEVLVFSSFIFVNIIADQINWNVDKYLLGRYHGTITVAIYGLAAQLNTSYLSLSIAISNVFIPRVHNMVAAENNNQKLTELFTKIGRVQFILLSLIASGLVFFRKAVYKHLGRSRI